MSTKIVSHPAAHLDSRAGKYYLLQIKTTGQGVVFPIVLSVYGNAFYVVSSPLPLSIQSNLNASAIYEELMGESFPGNLITLQVLSTQGSVEGNFTAKIWVGPRNVTGIIDHRTQQASGAYSVLNSGPQSPGPGVTINAGATNQGVGLGAPPAQFFLTELIIQNTDATNPVYLTSGVASNYQLKIPPGQTFRIPIPAPLSPDTGGTINFANPSGSNVVIIVSPIYSTTTGFLLSS